MIILNSSPRIPETEVLSYISVIIFSLPGIYGCADEGYDGQQFSDRARSSRLGHSGESPWRLITVQSRLLSWFPNETLLLHRPLRQG